MNWDGRRQPFHAKKIQLHDPYWTTPMHLDYYYIYHMCMHIPHPRSIDLSEPSPDPHHSPFHTAFQVDDLIHDKLFSFVNLHAFWSSMVYIFSWSKLIFPKGAWGIEAESIHPCNRLVSNPTHQPLSTKRRLRRSRQVLNFFLPLFGVLQHYYICIFKRCVLWWFPQFLFRLAK